MVVRISLIVAVVAGLAAIGIAHFKVKENLTAVIQDRDNKRTERDNERSEKEKAQKQVADLTTELDTTKSELSSTKNQLTDATQRAESAESAAQKAKSDLAKAQRDRNEALNKLKPFEEIGKPADEVAADVAELPQVKEQLLVTSAKLDKNEKILRQRESELAVLRGEDIPAPELPTGLKGRITSVDPKYDFVVLDIGSEQGVEERGELLISRKGKLIGKVRVRSVEATRSVANVLKDWKQGEPFEGDEVIY